MPQPFPHRWLTAALLPALRHLFPLLKRVHFLQRSPCRTVGSAILTDIVTGAQVSGVDTAEIFFKEVRRFTIGVPSPRVPVLPQSDPIQNS